ncbi:Alpha/Beta hydrolase protein [Lasiosphaeria hispida]|uniref:Probable dipeptidyl-aminopeptidase B n=1 Tax=Lasiosphaeria hispida TaxID=260671 RepID=A0AAJ0MIT1_9PEZI|nr:Alpha/Beta hydrolase protein [Lasiosphaeria hispida]
MTALEDRYSAQATVIPHWISETTLWYLRRIASGTNEFVFVDAESQSRRPAFDHALLAQRLAENTSEEVNPSSLPFSWIDIASDGSTVRFYFSGKTFQFRNADGELEVWEGDFGTRLEPLAAEEPSSGGGGEAEVIIMNRTGGTLKVYWIDTKGEAVEYGSVDAGKGLEMKTYVGHVWRVEGQNESERKAFKAVEGEGVAVVEEWGARSGGQDSGEGTKEKRGAEDGDHGVFVRGDDVWVRDAEGEHKITDNSSTGTRYDSDRVLSSPDGNFCVVWEYTPKEGYTLNLVESTPQDQLQPKLTTMSYLKPGDKVRIERPRMFDVQGKCEVPTDDTLFYNPYNLHHLGWSDNGEEYRFIFNERGHKHLRVIGMDRQGAVRAIVEESSKTFIDYSQKMYYLVSPDTTELVWTSERDGWNHLYLHDMETGEVKTQITSGEWVVRDVTRVDWDTRQAWITVYGIVPDQDPYYSHLARVNLDSSEFTLLTDGDGTHSWTWSPNNRYLLDTYSRINQLPVTILRDAASGSQVAELEADDTASLLAEGWNPPEIFTAPGRDGATPIYGIIVQPKDFDPSKKYAVIEDIYAGPHDFFTPKSFTPGLGQRELADKGFVVVKLDGMGTNWRSKAFHDVCYKNLKDGGIPDRIAWIGEAASTRSWMDLSRVGICGGSAGGQSAAAALIFHGGFYKAAVADCGCHDNRLDKMWWNEQWMGWPVDESYAASSNVVHAANLDGALMLIVGELDNNVDPASTLQVVKALNDADKDYEMLLMPGKGHGAGDSEYGRRRRLQFFRRWLGGESV